METQDSEVVDLELTDSPLLLKLQLGQKWSSFGFSATPGDQNRTFSH